MTVRGIKLGAASKSGRGEYLSKSGTVYVSETDEVVDEEQWLLASEGVRVRLETWIVGTIPISGESSRASSSFLAELKSRTSGEGFGMSYRPTSSVAKG